MRLHYKRCKPKLAGKPMMPFEVTKAIVQAQVAKREREGTGYMETDGIWEYASDETKNGEFATDYINTIKHPRYHNSHVNA